MKVRTLALIVTLALCLLAAPVPVEAEKAGKVYRIAYFGQGRPRSPSDSPARKRLHESFIQGLRERGWVEGQNLIIEWRFAARRDLLADFAAELVRLKVDLIVAIATPPSRAAKQATSTIPIVMLAVGDPVGTGLVGSLARPGGNLTGLAALTPELSVKWLELLKEAVPTASRVAVLWFPDNPVHANYWRAAEGAAQALGVSLQSVEVGDPKELESAFGAVTRERADTLLVLPESRFWVHRVRLAELAAERKLPTIYMFKQFAEAGFLMTYGASLTDLWRRAGYFVDKILKGVKPANLPVEQPMKFDLTINLKTAKALGLTIPPSVLIRADRVIR